MNLGMDAYNRFKRAEESAAKLGFSFSSDPYGRRGDLICLIPRIEDEALPVYNSRIIVFSGTLEQVESFIEGIAWARSYDGMLGLKTDKRRERVEQRIRNKKLLDLMKSPANDKVYF